MKTASRAVSFLTLLSGLLLLAGCLGPLGGSNPPPESGRGEAYVDITNNTYSDLTVWIGTQPMSTIPSGETHTYDMGPAGMYRFQILIKDNWTGAIFDKWVTLAEGATTWDVYDNVPMVIVDNNYLPTDSGAECVYSYLDGNPINFAMGSAAPGATFDNTVCPGEVGLLMVTSKIHNTTVHGNTSNLLYHSDSRAYDAAMHVTFAVP